ncbi:MAG: sugar ABC transporter permease [Lachnospiraceae bacterium]|nr:sugar ABC transporter permease [Lachnospiraceae bacterium]
MDKDKEFVFLKNYIKIFQDATLLKSIKLTLIFTITCIVFQFSIGFLLALIFKRETPIFKFMKAIMLIPYIIPATVSAIIFKFFFSVKGGILNEVLLMLGLISERVEWLLSPNFAMLSVIIANIWCGIPFNMILLSTGLANISEDYYESANIDGANFIQKFLYITIPSLKSSIKAVLVLGFVYTFRCYELIYVMTAGGPVGGTEIMTIHSYKTSFVEFNFGQGAAISNILFIILFIVGLFYIKMIGQDEEM